MTKIDISGIKQTQTKRAKRKDNSFFDRINTVLNKDISLGKKKFPDKKKLQLYNDLSMLLSSGIDIRNAFEILEDNFNKKKDIELIKSIYHNVVKGNSISEAFRETNMFTPYEYFSLQIGEETGRLNDVLKDLSDYYNNKIEQKRKIIGAFTYPIIVVITAILAIGFMLNFIVPMFEEIYQRFDRELPGLTKFIIQVSHQSTSFFIIMFLLISGIIVFRMTCKDQPWYKKAKDNLLLKIPLFGEIIKKIQLSRFCLSMELLLNSKLALTHALNLVSNMIVFYPLNHAINQIKDDLEKGNSFHAGISKFPIFDKRMSSLIKVGEEVNQLDKTFSLLKSQYQEEITHKTNMLSSVLEPLMVVFIGVFVAVILVSMYLPIFKISTSFGV